MQYDKNCSSLVLSVKLLNGIFNISDGHYIYYFYDSTIRKHNRLYSSHKSNIFIFVCDKSIYFMYLMPPRRLRRG